MVLLMVIDTLVISPMQYSIYLLGCLFAVFALLFTVYYKEYISMKRYLKYTEQEQKCEEFNKKKI